MAAVKVLRLCRRSSGVWLDVVDVHIFQLATPISDFGLVYRWCDVSYFYILPSFLILELRVETNKRDELMYAMLNCFGS
jgi:hypothetical protein